MVKRLWMCAIILCALCSICAAKPLTLKEVLEATCRIQASGAYGSGTCVGYKDDTYYILTNAHVVGNAKSAKLEFFKDGSKTYPVPASIKWKRLAARSLVDFAILTVDAKYFGKYPPRVIPLAPTGVTIHKGDYIVSAGCPRSAWATAWEGFVVSEDKGKIIFHPPPVGGQSGSGLMCLWSNNGEIETRLAAIVTWRIGEERVKKDAKGFELAKGGAIPIQNFYDAVDGKIRSTETVPDNYQEVAFRPSSNWALVSDGKCYKVTYFTNGSRECVIPPGTRVLAWDVDPTKFIRPGPGYEYKPPRAIPGLPRPGAPPLPIPGPGIKPGAPPAPGGQANPYGRLPDFSQPPAQNSEELEKLKVEVSELKQTNAQLTIERDSLQANLSTLQQEKIDLEGALGAMQVELDALAIDLELAKGAAADLSDIEHLSETHKAAAEEAGKKVVILEGALKDKQLEVQNVVDALATKDAEIASTKAKVESVTEAFNRVDGQRAEGKEATQEMADQRNIFGSITAILGVGVLFYGAWRLFRRFRPAIKAGMDKVEDRIQDGAEIIVGEDRAEAIRQRVDGWETLIGDKIDDILLAFSQQDKSVDRRLEGVRDDVAAVLKDALTSPAPISVPAPEVIVEPEPEVVDGRKDPQPEPELPQNEVQQALSQISGVLNSLETRFQDGNVQHQVTTNVTLDDNKRRDRRRERRQRRKTEPKPQPQPATVETPQNDPNVFPTVVDQPAVKQYPVEDNFTKYARDFFALKVKDGENPRHYAIYAILYKEAVNELRHGSLYYDPLSRNKLQGQIKTADAIEEYVRKKFLAHLKMSDLSNGETPLTQAMTGFLYKEAVLALRNGELNVLGAEATASAIETWVEKEFMRRSNIRI